MKELQKAFIHMKEAEGMIYEMAKETLNSQHKVAEEGGCSEGIREVSDARGVIEEIRQGNRFMVNPFIRSDGKILASSIETGKIYQLEAGIKKEEEKPIGAMPQSFLQREAVQPLPDTLPIPVSGVYPGQAYDTQKYLKKAHMSSEEVESFIITNFLIRTFRGEIYLFSREPVKFRLVECFEPQQFISGVLRRLEQAAEPAEVDKIKKMLLYDERIAIQEKTVLPATIWPFWDGLVDISTEQFWGKEETYFYTETFFSRFCPNAQCPLFDQLVASAMGNDTVLIELLWQAVGYILSNGNHAKVFFLFWGPKDTGKSLIAEIIAMLFEENAVKAIGINDLGTQFALAELVDKRLGICMDLGDETLSPASVGKIKSITGGDRIRIEAKYKPAITTKINAKLLFGSNHLIKLKTPDAAFSERMVLISFRYPVPKEKQDKMLLKKIKYELPGITVKAARAYLRLVRNNYVFPKTADLIPETVSISHEKVIADFAGKCCEFREGERVSTQELYDTYQKFAMTRSLPVLDKGKFSEIFNSQNPEVVNKKINFGGRSLQGYQGVRIKFQG